MKRSKILPGEEGNGRHTNQCRVYCFFQPEIFDYLKNDSTVLVPDPLKSCWQSERFPGRSGKVEENDAG